MTRREFLAAANAAAFLLLVESCSLGSIGKSPASPSPAGAKGTPYQQALDLLRRAVRASGDHLAQRSNDLVAARDAAKIVDFVRRHVAVVPHPFVGDEPRTARWWGSRATLRGGQGTMRDRADLLADLLTRAGFQANVMSARRPSAVTLEALYAGGTTDFAPDRARIEEATAILGRQGIHPATAPSPPARVGDPSQAIFDALPTPAQKARTVRTDLLPDNVPVVAYQDAGQTRYAFALGEVGSVDAAPAGLQPAPGSDVTRFVKVAVAAVASPSRGSTTQAGHTIDLVSAQWPAEQVVGRQVMLTFVPPQGPKAILDSGLEQLPVRVPTLHLQAIDASASQATQATFTGNLVTVHGDVLGPAAGAASPTMAGPFGTLSFPTDPERDAAISRVSAIRASVDASAFPEIELELRVDDAGGGLVAGLDARAFAVQEQGSPVAGLTVYSNQRTQPRPRVLVVYDAGVDAWKGSTAQSVFLNRLANALVQLATSNPFDVQVVPLGAAPVATSWAAPNASAIVAAALTAFESADDPWRTVGGAALDQGVNAFILISDFDTLDTDPLQQPTLRNRLSAARAPVFAVPIGARINQAAAADLVAASAGSRLDPTDGTTPSKLAALVKPYLDGWVGGAYRVRYLASSSGPSQRDVTVALAGRDQPQAKASYQVPANPNPPPSFSGLYVTVSCGSLTTGLHRLAGLECDPGGVAIGRLDDPQAVAETRAALDGVTTIAVEPGTTTAAALLDDMLTASLDVEPLRAVWGTGFTSDAFFAALSAPPRRFPGILASMLQPVHASSGAPAILRVAILQERAAGASVEIHGDLPVGINLVQPLAADAQAALRAGIATSVALNAAEAATFADTAYSRLAGAQLHGIAADDFVAWNAFLATVPSARQPAWRAFVKVYGDFHAVVPVEGSVDAAWVVNPTTGASKAVLLDTTGGGSSIVMSCHMKPLDQFAIMLAMLAMFCGVPSVAAAFPFECIGINTAAAAMSAALLFSGHGDPGTAFSLAMGIWNPLGPGLTFGVGVMLLMISYQAAGC